MIDTELMRTRIREKFGSQQAFGDACNPPIRRQFLSRILLGIQDPSLERTVEFARLLDVSLEELVPAGKELTPGPVTL